MSDDDSTVDRAKDKADETVCFTRKRLWALYVGAVGGVLSVLSHGLDFLDRILGLF